MTAEGWRDIVREAVVRHDGGDDELLTLVARLLAEQDDAKEALRQVGFGCTGMPWPELVRDIITLTTAPTRES
jgi:hypothetical protein